MRSKFHTSKSRRKHITSVDVGRYLKHLAALNRDPLTGNPGMSEALSEIAAVLIEGKAMPAAKVLATHTAQNAFEFDQEFELQTLSLTAIRDILARQDLTKADLTMIGMERFGIAKSRLERATREEIIGAISSAMQHEESLTIISEEARRQSRTS